MEGPIGSAEEDLQTVPPIASPEPIAIVGMGCRLPGGINKPFDLWRFLEDKRSGYRDFDSSKIHLEGYYHPNPLRPGSIHTKGAQLLDNDPRLFDHIFFSMSAAEVLTMDPMQRKMLEVSYEAMDAAGVTWETFWGSKTGVFIGNFNTETIVQQSHDRDFDLPYSATGSGISILSNRINHIFNLKGPSLTVDTACASSMYALHLAANSIRAGDCDAAIVGGTNLIQNPDMQQMIVGLGAGSGTSMCHTFDAAADGYCRAEGFVALYLRKVKDSIGKYPIRAIIRGSSINSNGKTAGISHPSSEGQEALIRQAYENAGLPTNLTGYVECHGTGTPAGDPLEVAAVSKAFDTGRSLSDGPLLIGSVKTNLGHSEAASGLTGIMKAILAMEHSMIPATIGIQCLNPDIDFEAANVKVVTEMTPWPKYRLRRVSVNSFGYGGANAHVILEHPESTVPSPLPDQENAKQELTSGTRRLVLLPFSGHDPNALANNMAALKEVIASLPLANVAYTLSERRSRFLYRAFAVVNNDLPAKGLCIPPSNVVKSAPSRAARIGFVFTGQGAQWHAMGRALFEYEVFRSTIADLEEVLSRLSIAPTWSLWDVLMGNSESSVQNAEISQTVCAALQIGIVDLLQSWAIIPHVTVGHSSGEIGASYASGRLSRSGAIISAYCRAKTISLNTQKGAMLAVASGSNDIYKLLQGWESRVRVAAINSSQSITLSGDRDAVEQLQEKLQAEGAFARLLHTDGNAYHSHHMAPLGEEYEKLLTLYFSDTKAESTSKRLPLCTWVSSVTPESESTPDGAYWRRNLEATVSFSSAIEHILRKPETQVDILVEIGPHSALQGPIKQIMSQAAAEHSVKQPVYLSALRRFEDGMQNLLSLCGALFQLNYGVDIAAVNSDEQYGCHDPQYARGQVCAEMPPYCYTYGPVLHYESRIVRELRERPFLHHDLLGSLRPGGSRNQPIWRNVLRMSDVPWLSHHRLLPNLVLPGSAYICLAIEAVSQYVESSGTGLPQFPVFQLRNIQIKAALVIPENEFGIEVLTGINVSTWSSNWFEFKVTSLDSSGTWAENATGLISILTSPARHSGGLTRLNDRMDQRYIDAQKWYGKFEELGLGYGPSFQGLSDLLSDPFRNIASGKVQLNTTAGMFTGPESRYVIHPATLDMCFQAALIATHGGQTAKAQTAYVPSTIEEITVWPGVHDVVTGEIVAVSEKRGIRHTLSQVQIWDQSGLPRVDLRHLRSVSYYGGDYRGDARPCNEYTRLVWKPDISRLSGAQAKSILESMSCHNDPDHLAVLIDLMGHRDPDMKIIQVGIDTEISTLVLRTLGGHTDTMRYNTFTIATNAIGDPYKDAADLSSFKGVVFRNIDVEVADASRDLKDGYDLIIAVNGLDDASHTPTMSRKLRNLAKISGKLVLLDSDPGRGLEWDSDLRVNAFSGIDIALHHGNPPRSVLISTAIPTVYMTTPHSQQWIYIIYQSDMTDFQEALAAEFRNKGMLPLITSLATVKDIPLGSRLVMAIDLESGGLLDVSAEEYHMIKSLTRIASSMLWLTKGDVIAKSEPRAAIATGLMRMLTTEKPESHFGVLHLEETSTQEKSEDAVKVVVERETLLHEGDWELECALHLGVEYIPRLVYDSGLSYRHQRANPSTPLIVDALISSQGPAVLDFAIPGLLSSAYFKPNTSIRNPLLDDWIEIKTAAISLNWKDLSMASGRVTSRMDWNAFNCECSGTVVACGTSVTALQPGDRVYALAWSWFGTHIRIPAILAQKMAPNETFEQMSTLPLAFCTAVYGLVHLGRLKRGQRVLIQTATGGFGLAALQVAMAYEATVYATVGTLEKRAYLHEHWGIPEDRIFSSREEAATDLMMTATGERGFDIILSTSTSDILHATWRCIAPRGCFIDVGRLDVIHHSTLALDVFERNATFSSFDMSVLTRQDPDFVAELMKEVHSMLRAGMIRPIDAIQAFDVSKLDSALLALSKRAHIGKFVVSCENPASLVKMIAPVPRASFDSNAEYVVVGGLGGFGRSILRWLVARGARHLTIFRRHATLDREAQILIDDLASEGATVSIKQVDVTERAKVEKALDEVSRNHPVKGILHTAMDPADTTFERLEYDVWKSSLSCKVQGTFNLHEASLALRLPLDFFVLVGSVMSLMAIPAHVGYCTANAFQDAFSRYRRSLGLPSCTIGFGLITEITAVARRDATLNVNKRNHLYSTGELETLQLLEAAFLECPSEVDGNHGWQGFDPLAAAQYTAYWDPYKLANVHLDRQTPVWYGNRKYSHVLRALQHRLSASDQPPQPEVDKRGIADDVDAAIENETREQAVHIVVTAIRQRLSELLEIDSESIDADASVAEYGLDSLIAVELRGWFMAAFRKTFPLLKLLDERVSIRNLAGDIVDERAQAIVQ